MAAIGGYVPRSLRRIPRRPQVVRFNPDFSISVDISAAVAKIQSYQRAIDRARRDAQQHDSDTRRSYRRAIARVRRDAQRQMRIAAGTDRQTLRAQRRLIDEAFQPAPRRGRITALDRYFGR